MASNTQTLRDEDGDSPDWIELHNFGTQTVNLTDWRLGNGAPGREPWILGSTNLLPGARWVLFASGKNRSTPGLPFHTDFTLQAEGDRLVLWKPDGATRVSDISFGPQRRDWSQGLGQAQLEALLVTTNGPAIFLVPSKKHAGLVWTGGQPEFEDTDWTPGTASIGWDQSTNDVAGLLAYWDFNDASSATRAWELSGGAYHGSLTRAPYTSVGSGFSGQVGDRALNFGGTGVMTVPHATTGAFNGAVASNAITVSLWIRGASTQPANQFLFWAGSQTDGGGERSLNVHLPWGDSVIYWDTGCCDTSRQRVSIAEPDSTQWKGAWNHYVFVKKGITKQIWQNGRLLLEGTNTDPLKPIRSFFLGANNPTGSGGYQGLIDDLSIWSVALAPSQIVALAAGASPMDLRELKGMISTDIASAALGVNSSVWLRIPFQVKDPEAFDFMRLRLRYNDGLVASINGVEITRRNAPETLTHNSAATVSRAPGESTVPEEFEIVAQGLLKPGDNILAIHGLNRTATDPSFLIQPQLSLGRHLGARFFSSASPGAPNGPGVVGLVEDIQFSVDHGLFTQPFELRMTCPTPEATIVYTLDGSEPSLTNGARLEKGNNAIPIATTTIVRAAGFRTDHAPSTLRTRTYLFPGAVASQKRPVGVGSTWPGGHPADFLVDSRVVNGAEPGYEFTNALTSIPTLSVVLPQSGLFGNSQGIYVNSGNQGDAWERAASMEWIYSDGRQGFQHNVGLRIHGGISRNKSFTPKHGFSVIFRSRYGPPKLDYPIFPDTTATGFDWLIVRAGSTDTWPSVEWDQLVDGQKRWYRKDASYIREQYVKDLQLAMGQGSSHGTFAHLYLNGIYWGLYNLCERNDSQFNALHFGGREEEYDVMADFAELKQGDAASWNRLMTLASADLSVPVNYQRLLGRNADGTRNPALEVMVDIDNLIDYMLLHIFITADDWPNHNWWAARRRGSESTGFRFFAWDQEISNNSIIKSHTSWGARVVDVGAPNTPAYVYARCRANPEFRLRFADHVQKHLFNNGVLTPSNTLALWNRRIAEVDRAVVAESARWGDYQRASKPYLRHVEWMTHLNWMRTVYFPTNTAIALRKLRNANLFPSLGAPLVDQPPGLVSAGFAASLRNGNNSGSILYTTDGSDPRQSGGAIAQTAKTYETPIPVSSHTRIKTRIRSGTTWSPLLEVDYFVPQDYAALQLTEVHYHPADIDGIDGDEFEFIECTNTGTIPLQLDGVRITEGVEFTFRDNTTLLPGGVFLIVANPEQFTATYPGVRVSGSYRGRLSNSGEALTFKHPAGFHVFSMVYKDSSPWPSTADGAGSSLQRVSLSIPVSEPRAWTVGPPTPGVSWNIAALDDDGDGMPNDWELVVGTNPNAADADADLDGDGSTNFSEYIAGTDPRDASSLPILRAGLTADGSLEFSFIGVSNRRHTIQRRRVHDDAWETWRQFEPESKTREHRVLDTPRDLDSTWYRLSVNVSHQ